MFFIKKSQTLHDKNEIHKSYAFLKSQVSQLQPEYFLYTLPTEICIAKDFELQLDLD